MTCNVFGKSPEQGTENRILSSYMPPIGTMRYAKAAITRTCFVFTAWCCSINPIATWAYLPTIGSSTSKTAKTCDRKIVVAAPAKARHPATRCNPRQIGHERSR